MCKHEEDMIDESSAKEQIIKICLFYTFFEFPYFENNFNVKK